MVKQAKQLLYLLISYFCLSFLGGAGTCLCSCVWRWVYQFNSHRPLIPPSPIPLRCSFQTVYLHALTHTHTHTHTYPYTLPPVGPSVCVCRHQTQGPIISAPTPSPPPIFLYSSSPASRLLFIHFVHHCTTVPLCFIEDSLPVFSKFKMVFRFCLFLEG